MLLNNSYQILYPDEKGILKFYTGQSILLICPGINNSFDDSLNSQSIIEAICFQSKIFIANGKTYPFNSFTCQQTSKSTVQKTGTCLNNFSQIEIGYEVPETFIPIFEICRDNQTHETYYARSEMSKSIGGHQNSPRPYWMTHNLFPGHNINSLYKKKNQLRILGIILDSEELANKYIEKHQLQRGHLAAKADFVYSSEQNSTFSFSNVAPQWSSFNSGNWQYIEEFVRKFVTRNNLKVTIYTGVHGQMTLRDEKNEEQAVFLDIDENNNGYIRAPKFYWKIIYDSARKLALSFIGVNDPFREEITKDMFLCPDISDSPSVTWLTKSWKTRKNITQGVSYICLYEELKKAVPTAPDLKVNGILGSYHK